MKRIELIIILLLMVVTFSKGSKKVTTEYTYYAPETLSLEQAKAIALQRAKIQIIAEEFGMIVSQTNYTNVSNQNDVSTIDFQSFGLSDLRGEWIETIEEPKFTISYSDGLQCVHVKVKGVIRQISGDYTNINVKLLRNSPNIRFESVEFRNNDDLFLYVCSPIKGFLAVYLIDNSDNVFCLLPYARQTDGIFEVEANKEYIFFNKETASLSDKTVIDEYVMTCNDIIEHNRLVIIFSENRFIKSADNNASVLLPRVLPLKDFYNWLAKARNKDLKMQSYEIPFSIKP